MEHELQQLLMSRKLGKFCLGSDIPHALTCLGRLLFLRYVPPRASQYTTAVRSALNILLTYADDDTPWAGAGSKCSICTTSSYRSSLPMSPLSLDSICAVYHSRQQCRGLCLFSVPVIVLRVAWGWRPYHLPTEVLPSVQVSSCNGPIAPGL